MVTVVFEESPLSPDFYQSDTSHLSLKFDLWLENPIKNAEIGHNLVSGLLCPVFELSAKSHAGNMGYGI